MPIWHDFRWQSLVHRARTDTDFAQSIVRIALGITATVFVYLYFDLEARQPEVRAQVLLNASVWHCVAVSIIISCILWPGEYWQRRIFTMLVDYAPLIHLMFVGGAEGVPLIAFLFWITIGYGLRFGRVYLGLAMACALASTITIILIIPYWQRNPSLSLMLLLCVLVIPLYPFALLQRTNRAEQTARAANADKSHYLAQASHDLRQPIHAIGLLAAQLTEENDPQAARDIGERISHAVHSTSEIVQTFLDVAVIESGTLTAHKEPVDLQSLFTDLEQQLAQSATWAKTQLRFVATSQTVSTDRSLLKAMLQNLISNAIKYAPTSKVLIGCRRQNGNVSIFVIDGGQGMSQEQLARIKEPFYRAPDANRSVTPGTGLGLAIVQRLSELVDLHFDVLSTTGRGTTAVLSGLPIAETRAGRVLSAPYPPLGRLSGTRVLLIEDDDETRHATDSLLKRWGCEVCSAAAPPLRPEPCDIIVSDFQFSNGKSLADAHGLLQWITQAEVPLAIVSGSDSDEIRISLRPLSPLILAKPVSPAELRSVLMSMKIAPH